MPEMALQRANHLVMREKRFLVQSLCMVQDLGSRRDKALGLDNDLRCALVPGR